MSEKLETQQYEKLETQNQALHVLVTALHLAQSRGVFKISESARISEAISLFNTNTTEEDTEEVTEEVTEEKKD